MHVLANEVRQAYTEEVKRTGYGWGPTMSVLEVVPNNQPVEKEVGFFVLKISAEWA